MTVSERELNPDPSSVVVYTRSRSLGPSLSLPRGPNDSVGPRRGRNSRAGELEVKRYEVGREERRIRRQGRGGGGDELARGRPGTVRTPPIILFSLPRFASRLPFLSLSSRSLCPSQPSPSLFLSFARPVALPLHGAPSGPLLPAVRCARAGNVSVFLSRCARARSCR